MSLTVYPPNTQDVDPFGFIKAKQAYFHYPGGTTGVQTISDFFPADIGVLAVQIEMPILLAGDSCDEFDIGDSGNADLFTPTVVTIGTALGVKARTFTNPGTVTYAAADDLKCSVYKSGNETAATPTGGAVRVIVYYIQLPK